MKKFNECYTNQSNDPDGVVAYSVIPLNDSIIQSIRDEKKRRKESVKSTAGVQVSTLQLIPPAEELLPSEELPRLPPVEELPQLPPVEELPQLPPVEELPQLPPVEELPQSPQLPTAEELLPAEELPLAEEKYAEPSPKKLTGRSTTEKNPPGNVKNQPSKVKN